MMARASSGSRSCSSSVDPLISANSAVTVLRSPSIAGVSEFSTATRLPDRVELDAAFEGWRASPPRAAAHCAQNLDSGGFSKAHFWHRRLNGTAHSMQNFAPAGFSVEQLAQRIGISWSRLLFRNRYGLTASPRCFLYISSRQANTGEKAGSSPSGSI